MRWLIITLFLLGMASLLPTITFQTTTTCITEGDCVEESSFQLGPSFFSMASDYYQQSSTQEE